MGKIFSRFPLLSLTESLAKASENLCLRFQVKRLRNEGFPGGAVVKNLAANAGDLGSSPGLGRSHMPRSNKARALLLLSLHSRARAPQLLSLHAATTEAHVPRARAPQQEKPPQ